MLKDLLDKASVDLFGSGKRYHLGASIIGARCARQVFYSFRKAHEVKHGGRVLRLFNRGHLEEARVIEILRAAGLEVRDRDKRLWWEPCLDDYAATDWETENLEMFGVSYRDVSREQYHLDRCRGVVKQVGFKDGHFAGSCDGLIRGVPETEGWGILEIKTHNRKSFEKLKSSGVVSSKPEHYAQMQVYMSMLGAEWSLYLAVCKDDDSIYDEIACHKPEVSQHYIDRAKKIIEAKAPPPRISDDPSWFECRFCDFREICHYGKEPDKSCFSCAYAGAEDGGSWRCGKFSGVIPREFTEFGCGEWEPLK